MRFSSIHLLIPAFFALVVSAAPTKRTTSTSPNEPQPLGTGVCLPATEALPFANNLNVAITKANEDKSRALSPLNSSSNVGGLVPITGKKTRIGEDNMVVSCMERLPGMGYAMAAVYIYYGKNEECVRSVIRCTGGMCRFFVTNTGKVLPVLPVHLAAGSAGAIIGEIVESKLADKFISDPEQRKMCFQVTADAGAILLSAFSGAAYNGGYIGLGNGLTKAMADPRVQEKIATVASKVNIRDLAKVALPCLPFIKRP